MGKTTLLELLELLAQRGYMTVNTTTAVVFRVADEHQPTLIFDEAETYITSEKAELIGIINGGGSVGAHGLTVARVTAAGRKCGASGLGAPKRLGSSAT